MLPETDEVLVNRNGTTYKTTAENMANLQDTDLMLVNRDGVTYTVTGEEIKDSIQSEQEPDITSVVLTQNQVNADRYTSNQFTTTVNYDKDPFPPAQVKMTAEVKGVLGLDAATENITSNDYTGAASTSVPLTLAGPALLDDGTFEVGDVVKANEAYTPVTSEIVSAGDNPVDNIGVTTGITNKPGAPANYRRWAVSSKTGTIIYANNADVRRSTDGGKSWTNITYTLNGLSAIIYLEDYDRFFGIDGGSGGIYSNDDGLTWNQSTGSGSGTGSVYFSAAYHKGTGTIRGTGNNEYTWISNDGGLTISDNGRLPGASGGGSGPTVSAPNAGYFITGRQQGGWNSATGNGGWNSASAGGTWRNFAVNDNGQVIVINPSAGARVTQFGSWSSWSADTPVLGLTTEICRPYWDGSGWWVGDNTGKIQYSSDGTTWLPSALSPAGLNGMKISHIDSDGTKIYFFTEGSEFDAIGYHFNATQLTLTNDTDIELFQEGDLVQQEFSTINVGTIGIEATGQASNLLTVFQSGVTNDTYFTSGSNTSPNKLVISTPVPLIKGQVFTARVGIDDGTLNGQPNPDAIGNVRINGTNYQMTGQIIGNGSSNPCSPAGSLSITVPETGNWEQFYVTGLTSNVTIHLCEFKIDGSKILNNQNLATLTDVYVVSTDVAAKTITVDGGDWASGPDYVSGSTLYGDITGGTIANVFDGNINSELSVRPTDSGVQIVPTITAQNEVAIYGSSEGGATWDINGNNTGIAAPVFPTRDWTIITGLTFPFTLDQVGLIGGNSGNGGRINAIKIDGQIIVSQSGDSTVSTIAPKQGEGTISDITGSVVTIEPFTDNCFKEGQYLTHVTPKPIKITPQTEVISTVNTDGTVITLAGNNELLEFANGDPVSMVDINGNPASFEAETDTITQVDVLEGAPTTTWSAYWSGTLYGGYTAAGMFTPGGGLTAFGSGGGTWTVPAGKPGIKAQSSMTVAYGRQQSGFIVRINGIDLPVGSSPGLELNTVPGFTFPLEIRSMQLGENTGSGPQFNQACFIADGVPVTDTYDPSNTTLTFSGDTNLQYFKEGDRIDIGEQPAMQSIEYSGNGLADTFIDLELNPDLVWIKAINQNYDYGLFDTLRGDNRRMKINSTETEFLEANTVSFGDSKGFTVGNSSVNQGGTDYMAWCFSAGDEPAYTNTAGSINTTVKSDGYFSVVTWTSPSGGGDQTWGHGLNGTPDLVLLRSIDNLNSWGVWFTGMAGNQLLFANTNDIVQNDSDWFGNGTKDATRFSITNNLSLNGRKLAYCWRAKPGESAFGSYTGANNQTIDCGFAPALVIVKRATRSQDNWGVAFRERPGSQFALNTAGSAGGSCPVVFKDNGFQLTSNAAIWNDPSDSYYYAAFASADVAPTVLEDADVVNRTMKVDSGTWWVGAGNENLPYTFGTAPTVSANNQQWDADKNSYTERREVNGKNARSYEVFNVSAISATLPTLQEGDKVYGRCSGNQSNASWRLYFTDGTNQTSDSAVIANPTFTINSSNAGKQFDYLKITTTGDEDGQTAEIRAYYLMINGAQIIVEGTQEINCPNFDLWQPDLVLENNLLSLATAHWIDDNDNIYVTVTTGDWSLGSTLSADNQPGNNTARTSKSGTGVVDSVNVPANTMTLSTTNGGWVPGYYVTTPEKNAIEQHGYLVFGSTGNVTGVSLFPQPEVIMTTGNPTLTFPATFDTGETPDTELPYPTSLLTTITAQNSFIDGTVNTDTASSNVLYPTATTFSAPASGTSRYTSAGVAQLKANLTTFSGRVAAANTDPTDVQGAFTAAQTDIDDYIAGL